jgi:hypothetical protein
MTGILAFLAIMTFSTLLTVRFALRLHINRFDPGDCSCMICRSILDYYDNAEHGH